MGMDIPSYEELQILHSQVCTAVAEPKRLQIICALHQRPMYVSELAEMIDTPQSTVSRHLAALKQRELVTAERDGAAVVYTLAEPGLYDVIQIMRGILRNVQTRRKDILAE